MLKQSLRQIFCSRRIFSNLGQKKTFDSLHMHTYTDNYTHHRWSEANHMKHLMRQRDLKKYFSACPKTTTILTNHSAFIFVVFLKSWQNWVHIINWWETYALSLQEFQVICFSTALFCIMVGCASCQFKFWCKFTKYSPRTEYLPETLLQHWSENFNIGNTSKLTWFFSNLII